MTLGTLLQAIISLTFIYLALALITSELQEYLATIFESRAKRLKQSIRQMLGEQDTFLYPLTVEDEIRKNQPFYISKDRKIKSAKTANDIYVEIGDEEENITDKISDREENLIQDDKNKDSSYFYIKGDPVKKYPIHTTTKPISSGMYIYEKDYPCRLFVIQPKPHYQNIFGKDNIKDVWINNTDNTIPDDICDWL